MSTHPGTNQPPDHDIEHAVRILVIDAHEPTRLGLALLLQRQSWVERCYLAGGQERATELTRRFRPHVAVVDISNLGPFVGTLAAALRAEHAPLQLVLTSRCAQSAAVPVRQAGAAGLPAPGHPGLRGGRGRAHRGVRGRPGRGRPCATAGRGPGDPAQRA
ncbi:hypothetical protein LRS13_07590 [Svornostia abyssi]|uniref:Response regulatory domain-containing protein n=1 Tax=Svornostia abyssi TaxID=2898438 RepID=A0ABY5PLU1_9ACTN|nr:hypothetical protein LRS13_07590 [Parviterribacteraceae bacterium J379]